MRRMLLALVLLVTPLVVVPAVVTAPPALAALHGPVPADESGDPQDSFVSSNGLFAYAVSDFKGGVICIVPGDTVDAGCAHPAWGRAQTVVGIGTQQVLLHAPPLQAGTWRLAVVDSVGGGGELSEPFTVTACDPGPDCDPTFAQSEVQRYKDAAKSLQSAGHYFCKTTDEVASIKTYVTEAQDPVGSAKTHLKDKVENAIIDDLGWRGYVKDIDKLQTAAGVPVIKSVLAGEGPGDEKAKEILKYIACATEDMADDIVADPPSNDYGTTVAPERYGQIPIVTPASANPLLDAMDRQRADGIAGRQSFERYQGAVADASLPGRHRQALAIARLVRSQVDDLEDLSTTLANFTDDAAGTADLDQAMFLTQEEKDRVELFRKRVHDSGFTSAETQLFSDAGFSSADIATARAQTGDDTSEIPVGQTWPQALAQVKDDVDASIDGFDEFALAAGRVAAATNSAPSVGTSSLSTTTPTRGVPVHGDATSASDPDGDPVTAHWDFGDGSTADGPSVDHTYASAGSYTARLTVSDGFATASASSLVEVSDPADQPPVPSFTVTQPPAPSLSISVDATASHDPEGGPLTYLWDFGDGGTSVDAVTMHTYATGGRYVVRLGVSDTSSTRYTSRTVTVVGPDRAPDPGPALQVDGVVDPQVINVLAQATDPDGDPLTVRDASDGVSCRPSGTCTVTATTPSFTYVVDDGRGKSATGAVTVSAGTPTPEQTLIAATDTLALRCCDPATLDVTANDSGDGLQVAVDHQPAHGSVTCTDAGSCTYTPAAGASGFDTFTYTLSSTVAGDPVTGLVRLRLAPQTPAWTATAAAGPSLTQLGQAVSDGGGAVTTAGVTADLPRELAALEPAPTVTSTGSGSRTEAPGWSQGTASASALLGTSSDQALPAPPAAVSQGSGGDGHVPIPVGTRVFAFFHHSHPTSVTCVDRTTGRRCLGYPKLLVQSTDDHPGQGAVVGTQLWTHLYEDTSDTVSVAYCWDSATDAPCGDVLLGTGATGPPTLLDGRLWWPTGSTVLCVDPATHERCAGVAPLALGDGTGSVVDAVGHDHRLYVGTDTDAFCFDVQAGASCSGWGTGQPIAGAVLLHHSTAGAPDGVCIGSTDRRCVLDADPATSFAFAGQAQGYYSSYGEADAGTRSFWSDNGNGLACWDWKTDAPCAGPNFDAAGFVRHATSGEDLPSTYGAAFDGTCVLGLGDPGQLFSMTTDGVSPCTSLGTRAAAAPVDLRLQRCDGSVGQARWTSVTTPGLDTRLNVQASSVVLSARDATTGAVVASRDVDGTAGVLDLSGVDPVAHPALVADARVVAVRGATAWDAPAEPQVVLTWSPDPAQECTSTSVPHTCPAASTFGVDVTVTGGAAAHASVPVLPGDCTVPVVHLVPAAPVIVAAVPRPTKLLVDLAPGDGRGSPILRWTVTAVPKDHSATRVVTSATEPVLVPGLRNNVDYVLTAVATNAFGDSAVSAPFPGRPGRLPTVTLKASRTTVAKGTRVTFTGKVTVADKPAGRRAVVLTTLKGKTHVVVARTTTSSKGTFTFKVKVTKTTSYQARFVLGPSTTFNKALRVTVSSRAV